MMSPSNICNGYVHVKLPMIDCTDNYEYIPFHDSVTRENVLLLLWHNMPSPPVTSCTIPLPSDASNAFKCNPYIYTWHNKYICTDFTTFPVLCSHDYDRDAGYGMMALIHEYVELQHNDSIENNMLLLEKNKHSRQYISFLKHNQTERARVMELLSSDHHMFNDSNWFWNSRRSGYMYDIEKCVTCNQLAFGLDGMCISCMCK
jgi:hypothetical protein